VDSFHNELEALILGECAERKEDGYQRVLMLLRYIGMELQRNSPADWNDFMSAACCGC